YTNGVGWSAPTPVEDSPGPWNGASALAVDASGNALAAWERTDGYYTDIVASHFTEAGGWEPTQVLGNHTNGASEGPSVAMDANGNGVAVWHGYTTTKNTIRARTFTPGGGWSEIVEIDGSDHDEGRASADVAMDSAGNAMAVWAETGSYGFDLKGATYEP